MKLKKGWMVVQVGLEEEIKQKFEIPISYLYHPLFSNLLDKAREVYGYYADGPLKLPCSVDDFLDLRWRIRKEGVNHHRYHQNQYYHPLHHHLTHALSFSSC
ncbi:unnamed protein product [Amaranthus hypochondriacus]